MTNKVSERFLWACETLAIAPTDVILEFGCGHGVLVSLLCEQLSSGYVTAIDRSPSMIDAAVKRNAVHVASGKAIFQVASLANIDFEEDSFNKITAINVDFLGKNPAHELAVLKKVLAPQGVMSLFLHPPVATKSQTFVDTALEVLPCHGFAIRDTLFKTIDRVRSACVVAVHG